MRFLLRMRTRARAPGCLLAACALSLGGVLAAPAGAAGAASACTVSYSVGNNWAGGFQGSATVTNNAAPVTSWKLDFTFPNDQQITNGWNGSFTQNGQSVSVTSASWNGALGTGGSATIGFTGTVGATNAVPTFFAVNGFVCNGAPQVPVVQLTGPAAAQVFTPGSSIPVTATAGEATASVSKVEFFATSTVPGTSHTPVLLGTATASPYTLTWASVPAGYYNLTAEAFDSAGATNTSPPLQVNVVPATNAAPQLHVSGNKLVNASGSPVTLHGVNRSGGEFGCVQNTGIWNGPVDQASITAMKTWGITAVRVPLNEACWNGEAYVTPGFAGANYINAVKAYVSLLNDNGIVAILDLHWTDGVYNGTASACASAQATCQKPMPDSAQAVPFWTSVANAFKGNDSVIFDLFNEPYPDVALGSGSAGWQCLLNGGSACSPGISYPVAGMQALVNAVRAAGAGNVLMVSGLTWTNDLTQWLASEPADPDHNIVASWHSYNFNACSTQSCWDSQIAPVAAKVPVIAGEIGENECSDTYITPLMNWMDSHNVGYLAWTWNAWGCANGNVLITGYNGDPTPFGAGYQAHLRSLAGG